jgi:hypothetical protein
MSTEQPTQQSAEAAELRNIVVHQASQLLDAARENNGLRAQNAHTVKANQDLVAEVQRLREVSGGLSLDLAALREEFAAQEAKHAAAMKDAVFIVDAPAAETEGGAP